jgi:hypothetical protein
MEMKIVNIYSNRGLDCSRSFRFLSISYIFREFLYSKRKTNITTTVLNLHPTRVGKMLFKTD